jgi:L-fucose mutarotase
MLKGIDPLLSPELLKLLAEMGHDDALVLADANFTAMSLGAGKTVLRLPGVGMARTVRAVASVLPLAAEVPYRSALQRETLAVLAAEGLVEGQAEAVERFAFYERVKTAYAIVVTGELQPWGNFILRKGVIGDTLRT